VPSRTYKNRIGVGDRQKSPGKDFNLGPPTKKTPLYLRKRKSSKGYQRWEVKEQKRRGEVKKIRQRRGSTLYAKSDAPNETPEYMRTDVELREGNPERTPAMILRLEPHAVSATTGNERKSKKYATANDQLRTKDSVCSRGTQKKRNQALKQGGVHEAKNHRSQSKERRSSGNCNKEGNVISKQGHLDSRGKVPGTRGETGWPGK